MRSNFSVGNLSLAVYLFMTYGQGTELFALYRPFFRGLNLKFRVLSCFIEFFVILTKIFGRDELSPVTHESL